MITEEKFNELEKRVAFLEQLERGAVLNTEAVVEQTAILMELTLPEACINGLYFNETKVHSVFEKKEDGNYYSRDILFLSARDTDEVTERDLLSEYLYSEAVREAFQTAFGDRAAHSAIRVFIPEKNQGVKKYNGVCWWYWIRHRLMGGYFCAHCDGYTHTNSASSVGGCAPAFCVSQEEKA